MIPRTFKKATYRNIPVFDISNDNLDIQTVASFGEEWQAFSGFSAKEIQELGGEYFDIITDTMINNDTIMADFGCGSGRFTKYWQGKAKKIYAIDPSDAVYVADQLIGKDDTIEILKASISNLPLVDDSLDFGMSIGVLHHIPNTQKALNDCVKKIKQGGYFFTYLYYSLDNRGKLFKLLWQFSNVFRTIIAQQSPTSKKIICEFIALLIYMPLVLLARIMKLIGLPKKTWSSIPLAYYHDKSFFVIRNDALDRFGTPLEQRFSKKEIEQMMKNAGLENIVFSENTPYWHAVGQKI